jgi:diaminopimelate epimerase
VGLRFTKYHGLGNDFVVLDSHVSGELISSERAQAICARHHGVGADGVITLLPPRNPSAEVRMHIYNADGSSPEMCGNGLRCTVRHLLEGRGRQHAVVDTDAGNREGWWRGDGLVKVTLGTPKLEPSPLEIDAGDRRVKGYRVSMGNPHFVLEPFEGGANLRDIAERLGPAIERAPEFPERTNVEFVSLRDGGLEVVVFERGVGLTMACGTGAGAAAVTMRALGRVQDRVETRLPGGALAVEVTGEMVSIEGEAVRVFEGTLEDTP